MVIIMNKEIISGKQAINMMILFIVGSSVVTGGNTIAKQDAWISVILAMIITIPLILIYARLLKLFPGQNLYDILFNVFGKITGRILSLLFIWYAIHLGSMIIRNFTEFIQVVSLQESPQEITVIFMGIICIWTLKNGIELLGRGTVFVLPIVFIIIIFTIVLAIKDFNMDYLKPVFSEDFKTIYSGALSMMTFPFAESVLFTIVLSSLRPKDSPYKVYFISLIIAGFMMLIVILRNILLLGVPIIQNLYFPSYSAATIINIADFITRIEALISGNFIISGLVKLCVCIYVASIGLAKFFNVDNYKLLVVPTTIVTMNFSCIIYKSTMEMFAFLNVYMLYAPIFQIILPIITLIFAEFKVRKQKKLALTDASI